MNSGDVTIGVLNYNGMSALPATLQALRDLRSPAREIVVVDNCSTDGSREWLQQTYPEMRCLALDKNVGAAGGRNAVLAFAATDLVFFMDNDISVEPDTLERLLEVMDAVPDAGLCHPEIQDVNDPTVHHYNGGWSHFLGVYISRPSPVGARPYHEVFPVMSGAAMLVRRRVANAIGGGDADYFFNKEDGDFTARITLAGYKCLNVPGAIVHHRSKPRGTSKVFYQVRNRWYFMLKLYDWHTLVLISPALVVFELMQAAFLLQKKASREYVRGTFAVLRDLPRILEKRRAFRRLKKMRDREWLHAGEMFIPAPLRNKHGRVQAVAQVFYGLCSLYWRVVRPLC